MATKQSTKKTKIGGYRKAGDVIFGILAMLFLLLGVVQIFMAGVGVFGGSFEIHMMIGGLLAWLALLTLLFAIIAHRSTYMVIGGIVLALLAGSQFGLASAGWDNQWLGGLHAVVGILAVALAGHMGGKTVAYHKKA